MKIKLIKIFLFLSSNIPLHVFAINTDSIKKYPYSLLTRDYGILQELDLASYTWGKNTEPFSPDSHGQNYWQCFPTKKVTLNCKYISYDDNKKCKTAYLVINVNKNEKKTHEYESNNTYSADYCFEKIKKIKVLMKNENHVCLGGIFVDLETSNKNVSNQKIYGWIYDKVKTKKGCESYFNNECNQTYTHSG